MATAEIPFLSVLDPNYMADPYPRLAELRERSWLASSELGLQVLTYEACVALTRDRRFQNGGAKLASMSGITSGPFYEAWVSSILYAQGAEHLKLKKVLTPFFSLRSIEQLRAIAHRLVNSWLDDADGSDTTDFVAQVASRLPAALFCEMLAVSQDNAAFISRVSDSLLKIFAMDPKNKPEIEAAYIELDGFVRDLIRHRQRSPGMDLVSAAVAATSEERLSPDETVNLVATVMEASTDNTANQICLSIDLFARRPDQWHALRSEPELLKGAVEECCRFAPRIYQLQRMADRTVVFRDVAIQEGEWLLPNVASAHRDPLAYPDPDEFNIRRKPMPPNLVFGGGEHACLGAPLARMEIQEVIGSLASRCSRIELADTTSRIPSANVQGFAALPVRLLPN